MLALQELQLYQFRNYDEAIIRPSPGINCFTGNNGSGKTNLLDAIHYLSMCRSYFNIHDSQNIRFDATEFMIRGSFEKNDRAEEILVSFRKGDKKKVSRNKVDYTRFSDHVGLIPVVIISPYDADLINLGSEERRKFLDSIIAQFDHEYLNDLINYNKALAQRNALLKQFQGRSPMAEALEIWDHQLAVTGNALHAKRSRFIELFIPLFQNDYTLISQGLEQVGITYVSHLMGSDMHAQLQKGLERDLALGYTTRGIHKDDLEFNIQDRPIRRFGSQGQQKSMLLALRTAQLRYIGMETGITPVLLLDDIFDKLDNRRIASLIERVSDSADFGQVFITDTDGVRLKEMFRGNAKAVKFFNVDKGAVHEAAE
jgi:DNA replication and repair protein RecF